jgi:putative tryptophan/tyrosine transport system substrate-binding protein
MRRREVLGLMGAIPAFPISALAQPSRRIVKIGHMESSSPSGSPELLVAFRERLRELGYVEGQNLFLERRYAEGRSEHLPTLAAELVRSGVDIIFAVGPNAALAAANATKTIPIVFVGGGDPVEIGLVKSLARPGGNVTGLTLFAVELAAKRLELLKSALPAATRIAVLRAASNTDNRLQLDHVMEAARSLDVTILPLEVREITEIERAFIAMRAEHADAALLLSSPLTFPNRFLIAKSALDARVPFMTALREYTVAGALMSYGPSYADHCRRAADFVHQIVNGAKPGDLPVQQPTRVALVINLNTANALGLDLPPSFLANADEVIG